MIASKEIEAGLLGICIVEEKARELVVDAADPDWFSDYDHRKVWTTIYEMHVAGEKIDITTVGVKTDMDTCCDLVDKAPLPAHVEYYIGEAREYAKKRKVQTITQDAMDGLADGEADAIIAQTTGDLLGIDTHHEEKTASEHCQENLIVIDNAAKGIVSGVPLPFDHFSNLIGGLQRASVIPIVGRDGKGKSGLLAQCLDYWIGLGIPTLAFCLEDVPRRVTLRMGGNRFNYSAKDAETGNVAQGETRVKMCTSEVNAIYRKVDEYGQWLAERPFWVEDGAYTVEDICKLIRRYAKWHDIQIVTIDGFKDIHHSKGDGTTAKEKHISQQLASVAKELNLVMPLVSHINKIEEDKLISQRDVTGSGEQTKGARQILIFQDSGHVRIADEDTFMLSACKGNFSGGGSCVLERDSRVLTYREI